MMYAGYILTTVGIMLLFISITYELDKLTPPKGQRLIAVSEDMEVFTATVQDMRLNNTDEKPEFLIIKRVDKKEKP